MLAPAITDALTTWSLWAAGLAAAHVVLQSTLALRVVMQRRSSGETLAWVIVLLTFPIVGIASFLLFGELKLGRRRERRFVSLFPPIGRWLGELRERSPVDWSQAGPDLAALARMCERTVGVAALAGNRVTLLGDWIRAFDAIVADLDAAQRTVHLEFYIWNPGGEAERVVAALEQARRRGVVCRVLVDALGSAKFLRSGEAARLRSAGVQIVAALPGGLWRLPFVRFDLRLHRKIVVIDGRVAYTGSMNLVDPRHFKQHAGVGAWVDAMVRIEGPAVEALAVTFLADWFVDSNDDLDALRESGGAAPQPPCGESAVQVLPTGPGMAPRAVEQILLTAVYSARRELVLTTPYFLPSEALSMALVAAARRGANVTVIVPAKVDSRLVRLAGVAYRRELVESGVRIAEFDGGLLHTKSVVVDGRYALFGSVNLDPRSFRLNFEITLAIYDAAFATNLRMLQESYLRQSRLLEHGALPSSSALGRAAEGFARILGPVL